jgi:dihydrofolate synthase/folylpolyglutamate synthase
MTYREACEFLYGLPSWTRDRAFHPGQDRVLRLLEFFGRPHDSYPIVHVAGTNGKGSVCAMIAAAFTAGGHRVGLHTSPHLFSFSERIRVNGQSAPEHWIAETTTRAADTIVDAGASFFEASTAMALYHFADSNVDLAVVEVGMGGRLDATNVVSPEVSVITNVGMDHTEYLGSTREAIAREKAGIIKPGVPVVSGCAEPEVRRVIAGRALETGSRVLEIPSSEDEISAVVGDIRVDFGGTHQRRNAALAIESIRLLQTRVPDLSPDLRAGLERTRSLSGLRGRSEILARSPTVIADVAHNVDGIEAAIEFAVGLGIDTRNLSVLIGLGRDKDIEGILDILARHQVTLIPARANAPRLLPAEDLAAGGRQRGLRILEIAQPAEAIKRFLETSSPEAGLLATGSHFVLGELPEWF